MCEQACPAFANEPDTQHLQTDTSSHHDSHQHASQQGAEQDAGKQGSQAGTYVCPQEREQDLQSKVRLRPS